jgi:hypothetical protein
MDDQRNQELKSAIAAGALSPRKHAFDKEVLRRRYDASGGGRLWTCVAPSDRSTGRCSLGARASSGL